MNELKAKHKRLRTSSRFSSRIIRSLANSRSRSNAVRSDRKEYKSSSELYKAYIFKLRYSNNGIRS